MALARGVQSELALVGGREEALRVSAANPRILNRIPRMRLCSFAFPSVTMGSVGGDEGPGWICGLFLYSVPIVGRVFTV